MVAPQRGQCQTEEPSAEALQGPASTSVEELLDSRCRDRAKREARKRLARKPKCVRSGDMINRTFRRSTTSKIAGNGGISGCCRQTLVVGRFSVRNTSQSKKGPRTPSATRATMGHKHGVSEAFLNCSQKASDFVSTCLEEWSSV